MTLEQLRIFVAVAEREHVTRAAGDLNLTQSAVSAAISALEERHATKLFDRIGRRIELTDAGRLFLDEARAVLARAAAAESVLSDLAGLKRGKLSLAASQTVANYWLPPLIQRFHALYPGVEINLAIGNTTTVANLVNETHADLGFVEGKVDHPALAISPVAQDELVMVQAPGGAETLPSDGVRALRFVFREPGSGTRAILESVLAEQGISIDDLNIALELPSNEAVRTAVEAGTGVAVLSKLVVASALKAGTLRTLPFALPNRQFFSLRHKERVTTKAEAEFSRLIAEND